MTYQISGQDKSHTHTALHYAGIHTHTGLQNTLRYPLFFMRAARCVVFIPGAAHISKTVLPGGGFKSHDARQLAWKVHVKGTPWNICLCSYRNTGVKKTRSFHSGVVEDWGLLGRNMVPWTWRDRLTQWNSVTSKKTRILNAGSHLPG